MEQPADIEMPQAPVQEIGGEEEEEDLKWESSRAYQAIKELKHVDKDIAKMLSLASSSILLLALPQTDNAQDGSEYLPKGEERSEQFVLEVSEYFQLLDNIQEKIREAIARVRQYRINPSVIDASLPNSIPPTFGVGLPQSQFEEDESTGNANAEGVNGKDEKKKATVRDRGLQETKVERDAWKRLYENLKKEKEKRVAGSSHFDDQGAENLSFQNFNHSQEMMIEE